MKLAVLAQTPPPVHGQSVMVQALLTGLPSEDIEVTPINLGLSRSARDIGAWRLGKVIAVIDACLQAIASRFAGAQVLYYVPAPGKRGALYRDWMVMTLCRPFFRRVILHWHATGLAAWLSNSGTPLERALTRRLLGRADLAIVLTDSLRADATALQAKNVRIVANGVPDPGEPTPRRRQPHDPFTVLFLGQCSAAKGLFDAIDAILAANQRAGRLAFQLVVAGEFPDRESSDQFRTRCAGHAGIEYVGFVSGSSKAGLLQRADCLCLPSRLPHEGQPLVLLEALAADLPIVASSWRGIPETVPADCGRLVPPDDVGALAAALTDLKAHPPPPGIARRHYLERFTLERHLHALAAAIESVS